MNVHSLIIINECSFTYSDSKMLKTQNNTMRSDYVMIEKPEYLTIIELKSVNCYLLKFNDGFFLIDSGLSKNRAEVEKLIKQSGCKLGDLKLILITHGDPDHVGNCAYIRKIFRSKTAMHRDDIEMVEKGDLTSNRNMNFLTKIFGKFLVHILGLNLKKEDRFKPDIYLDDGQSLSEYGFNATVYNIPGHSKGSIGLLTAGGNFFCGDLLMNKKYPAKTDLISDKEAFRKSIDKLRKLNINLVYPGHGNPFLMKDFYENYNEEF